MYNFLASLNLDVLSQGLADDNFQCSSLEDLQTRLWQVIEAKTTETRAHHVSHVFELGPNIQFIIDTSENDGADLHGLDSIDPSLQTIPSSVPFEQQAERPTSRTVNVTEVIFDESKNPGLQCEIAKQILDSVTLIESSKWILSDQSHSPEGSSLTYLCGDSHQHWIRQNPINKQKAIIGDYSTREPDPTLNNRPAFDCRGLITIYFSRSSRAIILKYGHTLLHLTVAQLSQKYSPPEPVLGPGAPHLVEVRQEIEPPRKTKSSPIKGGLGSRKEVQPNEDGNFIPKKLNERGETLTDDGESKDRRARERRWRRFIKESRKKAKKNDGKEDRHIVDVVDRLEINNKGGHDVAMQDDVHGQMLSSGSQSRAPGCEPEPQSVVPGNLPFTLPPDEAARRLKVARTMLSDAGVDPDSLSADQMNIFSNQSPEIREDSIALLAKYGAERLQIIHPDNKDIAPSDPTGESQSVTQDVTKHYPTGLITMEGLASYPTAPRRELVDQDEGPDIMSISVQNPLDSQLIKTTLVEAESRRSPYGQPVPEYVSANLESFPGAPATTYGSRSDQTAIPAGHRNPNTLDQINNTIDYHRHRHQNQNSHSYHNYHSHEIAEAAISNTLISPTILHQHTENNNEHLKRSLLAMEMDASHPLRTSHSPHSSHSTNPSRPFCSDGTKVQPAAQIPKAHLQQIQQHADQSPVLRADMKSQGHQPPLKRASRRQQFDSGQGRRNSRTQSSATTN